MLFWKTHNQPETPPCCGALEDGFWPEARDRRGPKKLPITGSSKPASDCFRGLDRNGALGQKPPLAPTLRNCRYPTQAAAQHLDLRF